MFSNMRAALPFKRRLVLAGDAFAELALWSLSRPLPGSAHSCKYRLAYVVGGTCVLRYDNETGKGDHRHLDGVESAYDFRDADTLLADFRADIARWNHENRDP